MRIAYETFRPGEDVIVPPSISTPDAKKKFGDVREVKSYVSTCARRETPSELYLGIYVTLMSVHNILRFFWSFTEGCHLHRLVSWNTLP